MAAVADLETGLQAMLNLKPPGVSGSRITSLTTLCVSNIQSESVLIQKIYTHFKKAPGTHKLGVLYVVDSVTRKWFEQAKSQGQPVNSSAPDGTYAAGVNRVTELMPVLMNDIIQSAPDEQKEKIKKLLDIWEKGQTFPSSMIESFKEKLTSQPPPNASTTPPGSPPTNPLGAAQNNNAAPAAPAAPNGSSILEALANIARQNTTSSSSATPASSSLPAPAASYNMPTSNLPQPVSSSIQSTAYPPNPAPVNTSSLPFALAGLTGQGAHSGATPAQSNPLSGYPGLPGAPSVAGNQGLDSSTQQQIMLIKALADQGVPFDKIPALIQGMTTGNAQPPVPAAQGSYPSAPPAWGAPAPQDSARDRGYQDGVKSPKYRGRSRSRSPDRGWNSRGSPRGGRDREYGRNSPRGHYNDRDSNGWRGNDYRQRSPPRHGRGGMSNDAPPAEKWIEIDPSLPEGHIKVYSRTLFVGGVTCSEAELRGIFSRFGTVQTCIVNKDKRHAFVKMISRRDSLNAKEGTEDSSKLEVPLRTRWGVGFGPRDCSDYATGISIIPIHKLTEADRKWMLTAPYGGSGGRPIESGMCVEEPDIEIGAGVSSKAISRRMQTDKGGSNGPKSSRQHDDDGSRGRRNRDDSHRDYGNDQYGQGQQQQQQSSMMPGFPFGIGTLPNGMPNFPNGFSFPDPSGGR